MFLSISLFYYLLSINVLITTIFEEGKIMVFNNLFLLWINFNKKNEIESPTLRSLKLINGCDLIFSISTYASEKGKKIILCATGKMIRQ